MGLSAASALIYEVVATNILFFYFIESSYSIATVLSVFLFGLGLGSVLVYSLLHKINNKRLLFVLLQVFIAVYAFFVLTNLAEIIPKISTLGTFTTSFLLLLIPTIFLGAIFPLAGSMFVKVKNDTLGLVYASDLFGAIVGTLIAGFLLIPLYGNRITIFFGLGLNILSAFIICFKKRKMLLVFIAPILVLTSIFLFNLDGDSGKSEYQFYSPSPYGIIKVENNTLYIDEREQCSINYPNKTSERMMAVYALTPLKKQGILNVLNIGLGCGLTLEKCLEYDTKVDVVEINPQVVLANKVMTNVLKNQRVNLIIDDGLNFLRHTVKKYDSILIDIENPAVVHSSNMYTVEAFELISNSLTNNGTFALWNYENFGYGKEYVDVLYYSLKEAFPFVYSYPEIFLAAKQKLNRSEYVPHSSYKINTIDKKVLTKAYLEGE